MESVVANDNNDSIVVEFKFIKRIQHAAKLLIGETHRRIVAVSDLGLRFVIDRAAGTHLTEYFMVRVKGYIGALRGRVAGSMAGISSRLYISQ